MNRFGQAGRSSEWSGLALVGACSAHGHGKLGALWGSTCLREVLLWVPEWCWPIMTPDCWGTGRLLVAPWRPRKGPLWASEKPQESRPERGRAGMGGHLPRSPTSRSGIFSVVERWGQNLSSETCSWWGWCPARSPERFYLPTAMSGLGKAEPAAGWWGWVEVCCGTPRTVQPATQPARSTQSCLLDPWCLGCEAAQMLPCYWDGSG